MATPDHPADSAAHLQREMALLTAEFATELAVKRLHAAIKLGQTTKIIESANHAVTAVMEGAGLVTVRDEDTPAFATIQASASGCLDAMKRAVRANDADGVLSSGELVGDAVINFAVFLKDGETK